MYRGFSRNKRMGGGGSGGGGVGGRKALLFFTHHTSNFQNHNPTLHKIKIITIPTMHQIQLITKSVKNILVENVLLFKYCFRLNKHPCP